MQQPQLFARALLVSGAFLLLGLINLRAGSATWNLNPTSSDWDTAANWTPATVPDGRQDTATFGLSNTTSVSISDRTQVNGIVFENCASAFAINATAPFTLSLGGTGVINNSGLTQNFVAASDASGDHGRLLFRRSATDGQ